MTKLRNFIDTLWTDNRGQDMVEYALLAGFVAVSGTYAFPYIAQPVGTLFGACETALQRWVDAL